MFLVEPHILILKPNQGRLDRVTKVLTTMIMQLNLMAEEVPKGLNKNDDGASDWKELVSESCLYQNTKDHLRKEDVHVRGI